MTTEIDKIAQMDYAFEKGVEKGVEQGLEQGRVEGREEEKRDVTRNLKRLNAPLEMICQATGLSLEDVLAL